MLITLAGSLVYSSEFPVPGVELYALRFEVDYTAVESGSYVYGSSSSPGVARRLGGRQLGLQNFYPLRLNYRLKSGITVDKLIDIKPLIDAMVETCEIPNLRNTEEGVTQSKDWIVIRVPRRISWGF